VEFAARKFQSGVGRSLRLPRSIETRNAPENFSPASDAEVVFSTEDEFARVRRERAENVDRVFRRTTELISFAS
jgi:hypothetical protein